MNKEQIKKILQANFTKYELEFIKQNPISNKLYGMLSQQYEYQFEIVRKINAEYIKNVSVEIAKKIDMDLKKSLEGFKDVE